MSYFDIYKKKLKNRGGTSGNSFKESGLEFIKRNFSDDPSYREATIISKENYEESDIDIRIENIDASANEKKIIVLPEAMVGNGDYIRYNENTFLVEEIENNLMTPVLKCIKCNQNITWKGLGLLIPCYITNDAYGSKILTDNSFLSNTDTKAKILLQNNKYTRQIKRDWRFIFNSSEFDIFRVIDITRSMDEGIITLICKKDKVMNEDDLESNIAFNDDFIHEKYEIEGATSIKVNTSETYTTKAEVSTWVIDDETIASITNKTINSCEVTAKLQDEYFVLQGLNSNGNVVCGKAISTTK